MKKLFYFSYQVISRLYRLIIMSSPVLQVALLFTRKKKILRENIMEEVVWEKNKNVLELFLE